MSIQSGYCDNTDCETNNIQILYFTTLTSDFNNDNCWWCRSCSKRDWDMIKKTAMILG